MLFNKLRAPLPFIIDSICHAFYDKNRTVKRRDDGGAGVDKVGVHLHLPVHEPYEGRLPSTLGLRVVK